MTPDQQSIAASEILGWTRIWKTYDDIYEGEPPNCLVSKTIPAFPTDANDSIMLVNWMRDRNWLINLKNNLDGTWEAEFLRIPTSSTKEEDICKLDGESWELHYCAAKTLPLAVLGVFLRANGVDLI